MKKLIHYLLFIFIFFTLIIGCQEPVSYDDDDSKDNKTVAEEWLSSYNETFIIASKETPPMFYSKYAGSTSYAGEILEHDSYGSSSGYILIKYTENSYTPSVVGKYYRIHWKELKDKTCKISGAYRSDLSGDNQSSAATIADAKANFTVSAGAFGTYSDCTKQ